ncbi:hypothetical protein Pcinc_004234 [Petrolisthes cinctipes]|uniref:DDE-1 domain-containing protein n=1 Tax=Petrolisthes cinctipes TaxID=88211 RepID=A0AAE1GEY0_PETCI|nr:hypothetical protein Pcinc_004234 [Petrolisthes cinctipes]
MSRAVGFNRPQPTWINLKCTGNEWSDADCFLTWLRHFATLAKPTQEEKHIIILDGHHSHKTLAAVDFVRENGIILITLPPHCTHKLQPLDVAYFKSLKASYNRAVDNWMLVNAGKRVTQYNVAELCATAFTKTATIDKAINGFRATGIWPFNDDIFTDEDFIAAQLTEEESVNATSPTMNPQACPASTGKSDNPNESQESDADTNTSGPSVQDPTVLQSEDPQPGTSTGVQAKSVLTNLCSPPKTAGKRARKRKAQKSEVITSSPYKKQLLEKNKSTSVSRKKKVSKKGKKIPSPLSSDDEEWPCLVCGSSFASSRPSEKWVQCTPCKKWSHEECTPGFDWYICHNCDSDED